MQYIMHCVLPSCRERMHFRLRLYFLLNSLFINKYNTFDKSDIIDNIGRHKKIDRTWVVEEIVNHRYPIVVHDYVLQKLNSTSSQVKRSIRRGLIFINGRKATNDLTVRIGDIVQLVSQFSVVPFSGHNTSVGHLQNDQRIRSVEVLFEDDHCAGMTIQTSNILIGYVDHLQIYLI